MGMGRAVAPLPVRAASPWARSIAMLACDPIAALLRCHCRCDCAWVVHGANRTGIRCPSHALANGCTHTQRCVARNARGTGSDMTGESKKRKPEFRRLTLCCPRASFEAQTIFSAVLNRHSESANMWHQSRDLTCCALQYCAEHARSWLGCGERWGRRGQFRRFDPPLKGPPSVASPPTPVAATTDYALIGR